MKPLALHKLEKEYHLHLPAETKQLDVNSPALEVFTDFKKHKPYVIDISTSAVDAEKLMMKAHVKMKIIVDQNDDFLGIVTLQELTGENIIKQVATGLSREEITVADLMLPKEKLQVFDYDDLETATVQDVLDTLKNEGLQHSLVIDRDHVTIRGLISASDIARKLQIPLSLHKPLSFAEIFSVVSTAHASK